MTGVGWLRTAVAETLDVSWRARAGLVLGLVAVLALTGWAAHQALSSPVTTSQQLAAERAGQLAGAMQSDLAAALETLPAWAVAQVEPGGAGQLPVRGRVVTTAGPACAAVAVTIGEAWLLEGDQDAVEVGAVQQLDPADCPQADGSG